MHVNDEKTKPQVATSTPPRGSIYTPFTGCVCGSRCWQLRCPTRTFQEGFSRGTKSTQKRFMEIGPNLLEESPRASVHHTLLREG